MSRFVGGVIGFFVGGFLAFYLFIFIIVAVFGSSPISDMTTSSFLVVLVGPVIALVAAITGAVAGAKHCFSGKARRQVGREVSSTTAPTLDPTRCPRTDSQAVAVSSSPPTSCPAQHNIASGFSPKKRWGPTTAASLCDQSVTKPYHPEIRW